MSECKSALVTGATGFLGSHLAHRLLQEGHRVMALARSSKNASAEDRVREVLRTVGDFPFENLEIFDGDISLAQLGLDEDALKKAAAADEVWHCAASLSFQQEDRDEIFKMNVDGTRNVVQMVERTPACRLQHVSTAYVAGKRADISPETEIYVGQSFRNAYEESKCQAELLIADANARGALQASIYRPSIVIGDSRTGAVTHFHGVYAFIRGLWGAVERLRRRSPGMGTVHFPFRVLGRKDTTLNFVPIDYVVDGMVEISRKPASIGGVFHLTNPVPTENRVWLKHICAALGVEGIELVDEESFQQQPMTKLEMLFQKQMAFYYQYLQGEPRFDCSRTLAALKGTGIDCPPVTGELIDKMAGWYVEYLKKA